MNPLQNFLTEVRAIRSSGAAVAETSFYPALSTLFNEIGKTLRPKVRCLIHLANRGAGIPDGGFFTADQFGRASDLEPRLGQPPSRGALEVKPPADELDSVAQNDQVARYLSAYGLVLLTNLREFRLLGKREAGAVETLESFRLADDEASFWTLANHSQTADRGMGEAFTGFISRVLRANAPLSKPSDLAWFMASYAREAKGRVDAADLPALGTVRRALEEALGMTFAGEKGEHFFRSTLVQTIFYGVFSAWVLWHRENPGRKDLFHWRMAEWSLHVPFIRTLYHQVTSPEHLGPLGLVSSLDRTAAALNRVDRAAFFREFQDEHAVQYFYEPFLEEFDPELRRELGVWYTPPEIVQYQVARIDTVLRQELGLADGLADPHVLVLDPCCGTGAYLVEVLKRIAATLRERGGDALLGADLKKAATTRIFGFEILPAPFVVAHLQLGLLLKTLGAPLQEASERVGVYLTNALTGWEAEDEQPEMLFPELKTEHDAADNVKRTAQILVVLGNPPYNAFAGISPREEQGLVEPYKKGLNLPIAKGGWGIKKFNLDDLYVRFFRLAERRIAELTGEGVVSFISNFSYLGDPSFVVMRQRFLSEFDSLWFDCLNGDSRETGKLTPEGKPDPSVFSTPGNREGIRVGTAIGTLVRRAERQAESIVRFRHWWGQTKREDLLASLEAADFDGAYTVATPSPENRFSFRPEEVSGPYNSWPSLPELAAIPPSNGLMEKRGGSLIDIDRDALEQRMKDYFDPSMSWDEYRQKHIALTEEQSGFEPISARRKALEEDSFKQSMLLRYTLRPFEIRWCYYTQINPIWNRSRPSLWEQCFSGNHFLVSRMSPAKEPEGAAMYFANGLSDDHLLSPDASCFSFLQAENGGKESRQKTMFKPKPQANLSSKAISFLTSLTRESGLGEMALAERLWFHALAIGYSSSYLLENADGIRRDWPRIPLPNRKELLEHSAALGKRVAALLDTETPVPGVSSSPLDEVFRSLGVIARVGGGALDPDRGDLALTAGWGHAGKEGVTMPGRGRIVTRTYTAEEHAAIGAAAERLDRPVSELLARLGADTRDVYLNDTAYWQNVPAGVWDFYIGGYQVIKKWLSYRERSLLGRAITVDEARHVTDTARRLAAILLLQPDLDQSYRAVCAEPYPWPGRT